MHASTIKQKEASAPISIIQTELEIKPTLEMPQSPQLGSKLLSLGRGRLARKPSMTEQDTRSRTISTSEQQIPKRDSRSIEKVSAEVKKPLDSPQIEEKKSEKSSLITLDSKSQTHQVSSLGSASIVKAMEEIKIEHILRKSPVRKIGESGVATDFSTNYIKLKCNNQGVYQYVVHYDPPVDSQMNRIKLLYHCSDVTGSVRLFDGHTLFLPILLKEKVTVIKAKTRNDSTKDITLRIQLTKILPPEQIPPTVFNIIFKK
jgi:hypothetical protein